MTRDRLQIGFVIDTMQASMKDQPCAFGNDVIDLGGRHIEALGKAHLAKPLIPEQHLGSELDPIRPVPAGFRCSFPTWAALPSGVRMLLAPALTTIDQLGTPRRCTNP